MTAAPLATTRDEQKVFVPSGADFLAATITYPTAPANGIGVILLASTGAPASGRNRIWVRLARQLAAEGYHVLRGDFSAEGDSTGTPRVYRLQEPLEHEAVALSQALLEHGAERVVLTGMCFGARTALAAAASIPEVAGLGLLAPPVRDRAFGNRLDRPLSWFFKRAFSADGVARLRDKSGRRAAWAMGRRKLRQLWRRATTRGRAVPAGDAATAGDLDPEAGTKGRVSEDMSAAFREQFEGCIERRIPMLLLFGLDDVFHDDFVKACEGDLGKLIARAGSLVTVATIDGSVHGLPTSVVQDDALSGFERWLVASVPTSAAPVP
jgi:pimeloyl-ACP methyl ester carboxylesterase